MTDPPKDGSVVLINGWPARWWPEGTSWSPDGSRLVRTGVWLTLDERGEGDGWFQPDEVEDWRHLRDGETVESAARAALARLLSGGDDR